MAYSGKYDPADFIVPPELGKGKSQRIQCNIQSLHFRALSKVARSGVFPFELQNDVIRWSIQEGLRKLDVLEPKLIGSLVRQANLMIDQNKDEMLQQQFLDWIGGCRQIVQGYLGRGEESIARAKVAKYHTEIMKMPNEPDEQLQWKLRYLDELEKNFPSLMPERGEK